MSDKDRVPGREFGGLSPSEAGRRGVEARRQKRAAEAETPLTKDATARIVKALRAKAERGDVAAARALLEYVEIEKVNEVRAKDRSLLEMISPELRRLIAEELHGDELPVSWPHARLEAT